jgi:hypothetical protein
MPSPESSPNPSEPDTSKPGQLAFSLEQARELDLEGLDYDYEPVEPATAKTEVHLESTEPRSSAQADLDPGWNKFMREGKIPEPTRVEDTGDELLSIRQGAENEYWVARIKRDNLNTEPHWRARFKAPKE